MTKTILSSLGSFLLAAAALVIAVPAHAEEFADKIPDLVWVDIGGSINQLTSAASFTGQNGLGATIDFEQLFDIPGSKTTFTIYGTARVSAQRRHVDFGYVNIDRSGSRVIDEDLKWGDYTFSAGGTVTADVNTRFIYGAFRYDFLHAEKVRISGSAGLSYVDLGTSLAGNGTYTDAGGTVTPGTYEKSASVAIPVPLIGFNLDWAIAKGLVFQSHYRFFALKVQGIDGGMYESGVHLNWYFIRNLGIGLGWDRTEIRLNEYEIGTNTVRADYTVSGLGLYATLAF
jgi:hypothetical protein